MGKKWKSPNRFITSNKTNPPRLLYALPGVSIHRKVGIVSYKSSLWLNMGTNAIPADGCIRFTTQAFLLDHTYSWVCVCVCKSFPRCALVESNLRSRRKISMRFRNMQSGSKSTNYWDSVQQAISVPSPFRLAAPSLPTGDYCLRTDLDAPLACWLRQCVVRWLYSWDELYTLTAGWIIMNEIFIVTLCPFVPNLTVCAY